jgi:predicted dehydrogenase
MKLAIIGCGAMGTHHASLATRCGLEVVACGDVIAKRAKTLADKYGARATTKCVQLTADPHVDVVAVCTPTPSHTLYIIASAHSEKHIFCEKPFGRTLEQCRDALDAVHQAGVKLFVGHVVRYYQEFEALREQVATGKVGRVGFVKLSRGGILPSGERKWYRDVKQSGGVVFDCNIHDFDWLRYMFGEPERVFCQTVERTKPTPMSYAMSTLKMQSGIVASVIGTWAHPSGFRVKAEICGSKGMIQYDSADAPTTVHMHETKGGRPSVILPSSPVPISPCELEWQDFVNWLNDKSEPRVTPEDALAAVRMGDAALRSAKNNRPIKL